VRAIKTSEQLTFTLQLPEKVQWLDNATNHPQASGTLLLTMPAGSYAYNNYPIPINQYYQLLIQGLVSAVQTDERTWEVRCLPGESYIFIVSGNDYPGCVENTTKTMAGDYGLLLEQTRKTWHEFTASRKDFEKTLPANTPQRERLLQAIDDVAVLIKTQQAREGSVLAGYNYHLGYIRDQYGVSRGLLKMGHVKDAKAIMQFYWELWKCKGKLHNAQGIGIDAFHIHENDDVEITGYLIIQAFNYLQETGDITYIHEIFPMLQWAWDCQTKHLHHRMLPFNGDETYIAGGILPRSVMFDGSAEATMLFLTGSEWLIDWAEKYNTWNKATLEKNRKIWQEVKVHYVENFVIDGKLLTNNSLRRQGLTFPDFRHGVCESCFTFGWTQKTANNRYLCPVCYRDKQLPDLKEEQYFLQSVSLLPWYINSRVLADKQVETLIREAAAMYASSGKLPSRPDGNRTVGYDYGLFLYSLTKMNHPLKDKVYIQMLDVLDDSGAWVEYYEDNIPSGTLCRPWESAINIEAAIEYAEKYKY
jgi:hypothetical protein